MRKADIEASGRGRGGGARRRRQAGEGHARGHRRPAFWGARRGGRTRTRAPRRDLPGRLRGCRRRPARRRAASARGWRQPTPTTDDTPLASRPIASLALGALNGAVRKPSRRAEQRAGAADGDPPPRRRDRRRRAPGSRTAFPDATPRVVVFVHGLCETEAAWRLAPRYRAPRRPPHLRRSAPGGTGLHAGVRPLQHRPARIGERPRAGAPARRPRRRLARRRRGAGARRPLDGRPRRPERLSLRRARTASLDRAPSGTSSAWARHISGPTSRRGSTPSPGRSGAAAGDPRARGAVLNARSVGIKDLRYGSCVEEDWSSAIPMSSCATAARRSRSWPAPTTTSSARRSTPVRWAPCSATCSCGCRARQGRGNGKGAGSRSRSTTAMSSRGSTTFTCSTTRPFTRSCAPGSRAGLGATRPGCPFAVSVTSMLPRVAFE